MKHIITLLVLAISLTGFAQKMKVKKDQIIVDKQPVANFTKEKGVFTLSNLDNTNAVIPLVGQIGKIGKTKFLLKGIKELSETKTDDLVEKLIIEGRKEGLIDDVLQGAGKLIDDALSTVLKTHPNFSKLGLSVSELDDFKALLNTKMPNSASDVFGGLKSHLDAGTSFENMQQMISGLKNNWGNFSDGSKWVFNYTSSSKGLTQFGGKKIRFELPTETELGLRRIDIADVTNPSTPLLYEFKSVQTPFNSTYATQFVKDLSEANSLSQIKWMYDGSKVSSLNKTQILNLIENSTIPQSIITKYLPGVQNATKSDLIDLIDADFNNIFKVVNL